MSEVKKTYSADSSALLKAMQDIERGYARMEARVEKLAAGSKSAHAEEIRGWKDVEKAMADATRQAQEWKRARNELIRSTNFVQTGRDGGGMINAPNFTRVPPPSSLGGLIVRQPSGGGIAPLYSRFVPSDVVPPPPIDPSQRNASKAARGELIIPNGPNWQYWKPRPSPFRDSLGKLDGALESLSDRASAGLGKAFSGVIKDAGGLVLGFASLQTVMTAVNEAIERSIALQRESLDAHKSLARGHAEIVLNTFGQPEKRPQLFAAAKSISAATGVPEGEVATSLARQAGRGVGLSLDQIISAQDMASQLGRHTPDQIGPLATAIQQTMRIGGLNSEQAGALMQSAGAAAFIGEPWQQSRFLQQTLSGAVANISNPTAKSIEESLELGSFITQAVGEERGEAGRTSAIALIAQMQEFRQGRGAFQQSLGGFKFNPKHPEAPSDPGDMIKWLWKNPGQAKRFADHASFERLFEGTWRNLILDPNSSEAKLFKDTQAVVGQDVPALREQLGAIANGSPQLKLSGQAAQARITVEQTKARLTPDAMVAKLREDRDEALKLSANHNRGGMLEDFLVRKISDFGGWAVPSSQASRFVGEMEYRRDLVAGGRSPEQLTGKDRTIYDALNKMVENGKEQLAELKQMRSAPATPSAGPAMNSQRGVQTER